MAKKPSVSKTTRKTKVDKKVKAKRASKSKGKIKSKSKSASQTVKSTLKIDLRPFYVPIAIFLSGLMIACSILVVFTKNGGSLFGDSEQLECDSEEPLGKDCLKQYAKDIDLDYGDFKSCLDDEKYDDVIEKEVTAAEGYSAQGTPFVVLGQGKGDTFKGFYAGGAQGAEYYELIIENIKSKGIDQAQADFVKENFGTLDELTAKYKEAYAQQGYSGTELEELAKSQAQDDFDRVAVREFSVGDGMVDGNNDAEITMMEFSDFECPYCQTFAQETYPQIKEDYVDGGEVRFIFRDFPLESIHTKARKAANAARCADEQGKFMDYHDKLYLVNAD